MKQLFEKRPDCGFVISTHDHELPLATERGRTLLVRKCNFHGQSVRNWEVDELEANTLLDDVLRQDLLGARRKIIFVEGTERSLDKPLYSLIFPHVSVIAKGSCRAVEQAVFGVTAGEQLSWVRAFGIVDGDVLDESAIAAKMENGVYAVPYYSVEAVYFHPFVIERLAHRQVDVLGGDATQLRDTAITRAIRELETHVSRLCEKPVKRMVGNAIQDQLPDGELYLDGIDTRITVDSQALLEVRVQLLSTALETDNWLEVLKLCSIRESGARDIIVRALKFQSIREYHLAVQQLLVTDTDALSFVRSLFADLYQKIEA